MARRKGQGSSRKGTFLVFLLLLLLAGGGTLYFLNAEGTPPQITLTPQTSYIGQDAQFEVALQDPDSGLRQVTVTAVQNGTRIQVLPPTDIRGGQWQQAFSLKNLGLREAPFELQVVATDRSWRRLGKGNIAQVQHQFTLDTTMPSVGVQSVHHNLNQGGSGMVTFSASEPLARAGVQIGESFFPAYQTENDDWICLFAFPYFATPGEDHPVLVAEDRAANRFRTGFTYHVNARNFPQDRIRVSDAFLQAKMPQFQNDFPEAGTLLQVFLQVNGPMRDQNRSWLREVGQKTVAKRLWEGKFLRLPNAARRASFGDQRTYVHGGEAIDRATHLGVDLASVARAEVPAANSGRVVFSDFLGIYGNVVVIDHGFGLQSLYAHLSKSMVQEGQEVTKEQIIGKTGATGLAGGDHLHFAMLVSGQPVNPVEWWDTNWIANNILSKWEYLQENAS